MTFRRRLTTRQREELWETEAAKAIESGEGELPVCNLCQLPVLPGQTWDASHDPQKPRWLGGDITGLAHSRCNRLHNNRHDTPRFAKSERQRKWFMDFTRSRTPMQGGRHDAIKKKMNGKVVER